MAVVAGSRHVSRYHPPSGWGWRSRAAIRSSGSATPHSRPRNVRSVTAEQPPGEDKPLLLDELSERLERFRLLYDHDDAATDEMLDELGGRGPVEKEMVRQLAANRPLANAARVPEAHVVAMRALEVLSRNGSRPPSRLRPLGPLNGPAKYLVQQVIRY